MELFILLPIVPKAMRIIREIEVLISKYAFTQIIMHLAFTFAVSKYPH